MANLWLSFIFILRLGLSGITFLLFNIKFVYLDVVLGCVNNVYVLFIVVFVTEGGKVCAVSKTIKGIELLGGSLIRSLSKKNYFWWVLFVLISFHNYLCVSVCGYVWLCTSSVLFFVLIQKTKVWNVSFFKYNYL